MSNLCILFFLAAAGMSVVIPECKALEEIVTAGKLPTPRTATAAVYDNDDAVYILGGVGMEAINDVLRYDLTTQTLQKIASFPHVSLSGGSAHFDINGDVFYFGGVKNDDGFAIYSSTIWKLNAVDPNPMIVAHLPQGIASHCSVYDGFDGVFTMGGANLTNYQHQIFYYSISMNATIPLSPVTPILRAAPACVGFGDATYLFGGYNTRESPMYLNTVLKSIPLAEPQTLNTTLPSPLHSASAVVAGEYVYLIGGETGNVAVSNYVNRFHPSTEEILPFRPQGFKNALIETSSVYIPKSNRIYVFGGFEPLTGFQDDIFYIQLD